ncbi:Tn3 family transposase [Spirosoma fluviale]|uniref:Tn3 family transposase n=1 Tax=Spirosoma fluviale TaxID=1597977 RepID=UPI001181B5E7|nr:Tn3 family transposase [Spirosoma fluviale]
MVRQASRLINAPTQGRIAYEHLVSQWDDILPLVVTIKLGYAKASTRFRRLNMYARRNPLIRGERLGPTV